MNTELTHILLIEDNPGDARLVKEMLADLDLNSYFGAQSFNITQCDRLSSALSLLAVKTFDIILVDLSLPDSQGIETVKSVCQIAPNLPIVVLSGQAEIATATLAVQEGAQDYLLKGHIDSQLLMRSIHYAIERKKIDAELQQLATLDSLTKLANRTLLSQRLTQALAMARRHQWPMAILFLDLDRFKSINDNISHEVGDIVLQTVANRLIGNLQASDTIARIGGDEFVIILNKIKNIYSVGMIVQRILDVIKAPIEIYDKKLSVTASIGISLYPDNADEEQMLLKYADMAMYDAKHAGGDSYTFYAFEMTNDLQDKLILEKELRNALINKQFILLYQPQIDLNTGMICGVEALLYLVRDDGSLLEANEIIPIIEELGLIVSVWEWVLKTALLQVKLWNKNEFKNLMNNCSLNISLPKFKKNNPIDVFKKLSDLNRFQLELGINEHVIIEDIQPQIEMLKSLGIHIALDNFFAGSASLNCIRTFQINTIKIAKCLIQNVSTNKKDAEIVIGLINIAHSIGSTIAAQHVETEAQMQFLRTHGCDKAQGSFICKPVDAKTLLAIMRKGIVQRR